MEVILEDLLILRWNDYSCYDELNEQVDIDILNMVRILATDIKRSSGDGSTTATKILF